MCTCARTCTYKCMHINLALNLLVPDTNPKPTLHHYINPTAIVHQSNPCLPELPPASKHGSPEACNNRESRPQPWYFPVMKSYWFPPTEAPAVRAGTWKSVQYALYELHAFGGISSVLKGGLLVLVRSRVDFQSLEFLFEGAAISPCEKNLCDTMESPY